MPTTPGQVLKGGYQSHLVLTALASRDLAGSYPAVRNAYIELYDNIAPGSAQAFQDRAKLSLQRAGFSADLIAGVPWANFTPSVRNALSVLRNNLGVFDPYSGGGCPCLTDLIDAAKLKEVPDPPSPPDQNFIGVLPDSAKLTELESENARLKQLVTYLTRDKEALEKQLQGNQ